MGICQSKRDLIPVNSLHVMLGVKNDEEFRRRCSQEDEGGNETSHPGPYTYRPSSLNQILDTLMENQDRKHRRVINKRGTMDTAFSSLGSVEVEEGKNISAEGTDNVYSTSACAALAEPKEPNVSRCSLAA